MSVVAALTRDSINFEFQPILQLLSKLNELSINFSDLIGKKTNFLHSTSKNIYDIFSPLSDVIDIAISSSHVAFLLSSNHVCRIKYRVLPIESTSSFGLQSNSECLNNKYLKPNRYKKEVQINNEVHLTHGGILPHETQKHNPITCVSTLDSTYITPRMVNRGRAIRCSKNSGRLPNMRNSTRNPPSNLRRSFLINPSHTIVPSSEIPEELIQQAQTVLQGKSRSLIIRELQRTGIDVNQAVNNLLSKDDDCDEDESTTFSSDDLFYLLETGGRAFQMPMELDAEERKDVVLDPSMRTLVRDLENGEFNSGRESKPSFPNSNFSANQFEHISNNESLIDTCDYSIGKVDESNSDYKLIELQCESQQFDINSNKSDKLISLSPRVEFYGDPEWWVESEMVQLSKNTSIPPSNSLYFSKISATDTDLIAITTSGHLSFWPWAKNIGIYSPSEHSFPNFLEMELKFNDQIKFLSTSRFRISIVTSGNAIASWCDRGLRLKIGSSSFDTPLQQLRLNVNQFVIALSCCDLYAACLTTGGVIYWWGCMPYLDRKKAIARIKNLYLMGNRKENSLEGNSRPELLIREGDNVFIRESPYYSIGTIGLCIHKDAKVGILQENVYSLNERYRFKLYHPTNSAPDYETISDDLTQGKNPSLSGEHSYSSSISHSWHCKDVIFFKEPLFHSSVGDVIKVDGNLVVVHIPSNSNDNTPIDISCCRIVKKEELILKRSANCHKGPVCIHIYPKKILIPSDCMTLSINADTKGLYILYIQNGTPKLSTSLLEDSQFYNSLYLPKSLYSYLIQSRRFKFTLAENNNSMQNGMILRDDSGNLLFLIKSQSNSFKELPLCPISPICAFDCYHDLSNKFILAVLSCKKQTLSPYLVTPLPKKVFEIFELAYDEHVFLSNLTKENTNGNHNLLHTTIRAYNMHRLREANEFSHSIGNTPENQPTSSNLNIKMRHYHPEFYQFDETNAKITVSSNQKYSVSSPIISEYSSNIQTSEHDQDIIQPISSPNSNIDNFSKDNLQILLNSLGPYLTQLLTEKNIDSLTPFMQAVKHRAYDISLILLSAIINASKSPPPGLSKSDYMLSMLFPINSFPDDNPLFLLCTNDSCSVTWTGETHERLIDIYECHTCGLVGDFCCCTECSIVCHRGHELFRKLQPMKAFCDCRRLCCCRALYSGNQNLRIELFVKLITNTKLYTQTNSSDEFILSFLVKTFSRQVREQGIKLQQLNVSNSLRLSLPSNYFFSKTAFEICLNNWFIIECMFSASSLITSCGLNKDSNFLVNNIANFHSDHSNPYLENQKGSTHIDTFVYSLITQNNSDLIVILLSTLSQAYRDKRIRSEYIISRFIRSVIRIYLISSYDVWGLHPQLKKNRDYDLYDQVQIIFRSMKIISIKELWSIACAIVTPIQLGIVKPCIPLPNEIRKKNLVDEFFRTCSYLPTNDSFRDSNIKNTTLHDTDNISSSDLSEGINSPLNDSEFNITAENISETTRATIGSSHIVPYFSGDSGSDSDDNHVDGRLDFSFDPHNNKLTDTYPQSLTLTSQINPKYSNVTPESVEKELLSPNILPDQWLEDNSSNVVENSAINPLHFSDLLHDEDNSKISLKFIEGDNKNVETSVFSDDLWQPSFEVLSNINITSPKSRRLNNYLNHSHDNLKPSQSFQDLLLSKAFHFLIVDLINLFRNTKVPTEYSIPCNYTELSETYNYLWSELEPLLLWLIQVMDPLESQLRFGSFLVSPYSSFLTMNTQKESIEMSEKYLSLQRINQLQNNSFSFSTDASKSPKYETYTANIISAKDSNSISIGSLEYLLSLTRSASFEHREFIPPIDLSSLEHIAYILDAVLFFLYCHSHVLNNQNTLHDLTYDLSKDISKSSFELLTDNFALSKIRCGSSNYHIPPKEIIQEYFKRSSCLSFIGCPSPSYLSPIESLPVAEIPQLLQPHIRREVLFGAPQDPIFPDTDIHSPFHSRNILTKLLSCPLLKCFSQGNRFSSSFSSANFEETNKDGLVSKIFNYKRAANVLMGRWRFTIELYCKLLFDNKKEDIKILKLLEDFPTKESRFREEMEKLTFEVRKEQRELLFEISRERKDVIFNTVRQLHNYVEERKGLLTPLCVKQVKVTFKNEQGEGSGVARSFYTCFAQAILSNENLPNLDSIILVCSKNINSLEETHLPLLSSISAPFHPHCILSDIGRDRIAQGARIYPQVSKLIGSLHSDKVTGMLLDLPNSQLNCINNDNAILRQYAIYAYENILNLSFSQFFFSGIENDPSILLRNLSGSNSSLESSDIPNAKRTKQSDFSELTPLFFEPGRSGFYSPRAGKYTTVREQCYLCVGRIIGLCLLTNEILPISFSRHVLKYLLGKEDTICWHDYAFMDPVSFESLRMLLLFSKESDLDAITSMGLTFEISLSPFECDKLVDLVENGSSLPVTIENSDYYVKLYTEYRMKIVVRQALMDMQIGLSEVIPMNYFSNINPEDLRLLLNGCNSFNLESFKSIVGINNESRQDDKLVLKFMKWFWAIVFGFSEKEKQDLLYFWTSSPNIPASFNSYQPEPSIHIRPSDDQHLPTANTCIARLYIPLYSRKSILKSKLLLAIKTKIFGFV